MRVKVKNPKAKKPVLMCGWFMNCKREATGVTAHPVLTYVPTCAKCAEFAGGEQIPLSQVNVEWEKAA